MITQTNKTSGYTLVELQIKEANLVEADRFKNEMIDLIDQGDSEYIVSFEKVDYIDSSFLGALVSSLKYAMTKKANVSVAYLNDDIFNLFQLIRMDKVFKVYTALPEKIES